MASLKFRAALEMLWWEQAYLAAVPTNPDRAAFIADDAVYDLRGRLSHYQPDGWDGPLFCPLPHKNT